MTGPNTPSLRHFLKLLDPVGIEEFLSDYYEQRALYVHRADAMYFAELLESADIDRFFVGRGVANSIIRVNKDGRDVSRDRFSHADTPGVSNERLLKLFASGHSIIINNGRQIFLSLDRFCHAVEEELRFTVQPNIYITPFDAQAFETHYDYHDVVILQVMGSKRWRIFHSAIELASSRQECIPGSFTVGAPEMEVTLAPGDSLYIPRGVLHDARTSGETSAHITFGLHPFCRFDLLQELTHLAQDTPAFRKAIPLGLLRDRSTAVEEFRALLLEFLNTLDVETLIERKYSDFVQRKTVHAHHRFLDLAQLNRVSPGSVVRRRANVLYTIERDERGITVCFADNRIPVQAFLEEALDVIRGDAAFAIRDIPGFLTEKSRLDLARTFLQAGFLEIVELNGAGPGSSVDAPGQNT